MFVNKTQPVIYLDIDGVVNALGGGASVDKQRLKYWSEWKTDIIPSKAEENLTIVHAPELITRLNAVTEKAHVIFLSMWMRSAVDEFAPLVGLNVSEFADADGWNRVSERYILSIKERWWKLNLVIERMDVSTAPTVWIDDWMNDAVKKFIENYAASKDIEILVVKPDEQYGITPAMMRKIERFVGQTS